MGMMGAGLRPSGKPLDQPPYPKMQGAPHFYPDPTALAGMGLPRALCRLRHGELQALQPHHLVWVTKYRHAVPGGDIGQRCRELLRETARAHER